MTSPGGCGCPHGHADDGNELGAHYTLFQKVDLVNVVCLNEEVEGSGKTVFKPWNERLCRQKVKNIMKRQKTSRLEEIGFSLFNLMLTRNYCLISPLPEMSN